MSRYERLAQISGWNLATVSGARAVLVGCGALGNEVAKNLALVGWGTIVLVDFDIVEETNLSRSVFFRLSDRGKSKAVVLGDAIAELNPDCKTIALIGSALEILGAGTVSRCDVVFGCLDNILARLVVNRLAGTAGRIFIDGGLGAWQGTVSSFGDPGGACYACGLDSDDLRELGLRGSCHSFAEQLAAEGGVPTTPTIASTVAAEMVALGLKWVHGRRDPKEFPLSYQLRWDQAFNRFWKVRLPHNPDCLGHPSPAEPIAVPGARWDQSWAAVLAACRAYFGNVAALRLPCEIYEDPAQPATHRKGFVEVLGKESWVDQSPREMGLPEWSWLSVDTPQQSFTIELDGPNQLCHLLNHRKD